MLVMIAGLVVFLGTHSLRMVADGWCTAQIARVGTFVFALVGDRWLIGANPFG